MSRSPDRRVFWLLERASAALRLRVERLAVEHLGATAAQLPVVFALASRDQRRPGELAEELGVNAAAITGLIGRMEASGLVRRRSAPDDGRAQLLSLTAEGRRIAARARPQIGVLQAELLEGFTDAEVAAVLRFLRAVIERAPTLGAAASGDVPRALDVRSSAALGAVLPRPATSPRQRPRSGDLDD